MALITLQSEAYHFLHSIYVYMYNGHNLCEEALDRDTLCLIVVIEIGWRAMPALLTFCRAGLHFDLSWLPSPLTHMRNYHATLRFRVLHLAYYFGRYFPLHQQVRPQIP